MSLISKWYPVTLVKDTDSQNTPEVDLHESFEAIEIDIPTIETAEVQIKGSNQSAGAFDLIGQEEPVPSSIGGFRTTVPLGGKYQFIKVYLSAAQTSNRTFAVRGISYASAGLVTLIDRIKNMRIDVGDIEVNTSDIEDGIDELKVLVGAISDTPTENTVMDRLKEIEDGIDELNAEFGVGGDGLVAAGAVGTLHAKIRRISMDIEGLKTSISLNTSTNVIGLAKLVSPDGSEITDDTADAINAKLVDAAGNVIEKAEDATHTSGDKGFMALGVRKDKHEAIATADLDYSPEQLDKWGGVRQAEWGVGKPLLTADNSGWAVWEKVVRNANYVLGTEPNRQFRQGPWAAHLNGGLQKAGAWEDQAAIWLPINEMKLTDLDEIMYTYYKFLAGTADVGLYAPSIGIRVHDPDNHDARAEITLAVAGGDAVTEGWHETFVNSAASLFYFGNNVGSPDICTGEGPGNPYTWANFQDDVVFSTWTVYQIEVFYGMWGGTCTAGDVWIGSIQINDIPVKMEPADLNDLGTRKGLTGSPFGKPSLSCENNGRAGWIRGTTIPLTEKGSTGWLAELNGGVQTGDDWARLNIPVDELPVPLFSTAMWSYYQDAAESFGVNMVIWVHDPYDYDIRAEITQLANHADLEKGAGWNAHELNQTTDQFFYYGEGIANTSLITGTGATNLFGWDDFQGDERFNSMTIYRITFEKGWQASGTFVSSYVADVKLNGELIHLEPDTPVITKRIETELLAITKVAANGQQKSSELALTNIEKVAILISHGRTATTAFVVAGTEYRIEVSEKASGDDAWRAIASAVCGIAAATEITADGNEAAGEVEIDIGANTPVVNDIIFWENTTLANSEWMKVVAITGGTDFTMLDALTNSQTAAKKIYSKGEQFVLSLDVSDFTRLRVVVNNNNGSTNAQVASRIAAIVQR